MRIREHQADDRLSWYHGRADELGVRTNSTIRDCHTWHGMLPSSYLFLHVQENGRHLVSMATDNKISTAAQGHGRIFRLLGLQVSPRK